MTDIVEELRRSAFRGPTMTASHTHDVRWRAADEIERLRAANTELQGIDATLQLALERAQRERDEARASALMHRVERDGAEDHATEIADELRTKNSKHRAVVDAWREAEADLATVTRERDEARAALRLPDKDRRQWFLADLTATRGWFRRADLCREFGVSVPQASNDIRVFLANHPFVATYNKSEKRYERAAIPPPPEGKP